jgi:hypothetical protein
MPPRLTRLSGSRSTRPYRNRNRNSNRHWEGMSGPSGVNWRGAEEKVQVQCSSAGKNRLTPRSSAPHSESLTTHSDCRLHKNLSLPSDSLFSSTTYLTFSSQSSSHLFFITFYPLLFLAALTACSILCKAHLWRHCVDCEAQSSWCTVPEPPR